MPNQLIVAEEFFGSKFVPAQCLLSGATDNLRIRMVKADRNCFGTKCVFRTIIGFVTLGLGGALFLADLSSQPVSVPCERRAWMRWSLQRNLGAVLLLLGPLVGFGIACATGDASMLLLYFQSPRMICGCGSLGQAIIVWLAATPGGWATLSGLAAGLIAQGATLGYFHSTSVTLRHDPLAGEVEIHFPDAMQERYQLWRDAYIAYTKDWNATHPDAPVRW